MRKLVPLGIVALSLAACSGGGSVEDFAPAPATFDISGSVTGLNGALTLGWGSTEFVLSADGDFVIEDAFRSSDTFDLTIVDSPFQQACVLSGPTRFSDQTSDISGVDITCEDRNVMRVFVFNLATGEPLADVPLTATWDENGAPGTLQATSGANGEWTFDLEEFDSRVVVSAELDGFAQQSQIMINTSTAGLHAATLYLLANDLSTEFEAAAGGNLDVNDVTVLSVPPNALVDESGAAYDGTVTAAITLIDPSGNAGVLPGDYLGQDAFGDVYPVQSFGGVQVTLVGSAGQQLQVAVGQSVTINIPVAQATGIAAPTTASLYSYDEETGYLVEDVLANLQTVGGTTVYTASVTQFGTWTAGEPYVPQNITGCVVDSSGAPFPNLRVDGNGASFLGSTYAISDAQGTFTLPANPGSTMLVTAGDGYQSQTLEATAGQTLGECLEAALAGTTINLSWGVLPGDLDTHFFGFSAENSSDDFHVDFTNRNVTVNDVEIDLDVDDVSSYGPEVVTVPRFPFAGVYRYAVHKYSSDEGTIQSSPARVELNLGGSVSVFTPPEGSPTLCWAVFDITVDDDGTFAMAPINTWQDAAYCSSGTFDRPL